MTEYKKIDPDYSRDLWETSKGLQETDGLETSAYLDSLIDAHLKGEVEYQEIEKYLNQYYATNSHADESSHQADVVATRMTELLSDDSFSFTPATLIAINRYLFHDIFEPSVKVGEFRDYNISKPEPVLGGESVIYDSFFSIQDTLKWEFSEELLFDYNGADEVERAHHAMQFISNIWQVHPFGEGNTRTTTVFAIKYLRKLGFTIDNTPFAENALYYRNSLVREHATGEKQDSEFFQKFSENILLGGNNVLDNDELFVNRLQQSQDVNMDEPKRDF